MRNTSISDTRLIRAVLASVRATLVWCDVEWEPKAGESADQGIDGYLSIRVRDRSGATGRAARIPVQVRSSLHGLSSVLELFSLSEKASMPMLFVEYATASLREAADRLGISFADTTGWVSIVLAGPTSLLVKAQGALRPPVSSSGNRSINRLDGPGASGVVRALWAVNRFPMGVRELAKTTQQSPGTISKVLPALEAFGAIQRDTAGQIVGVDRRLLLDRWLQDYSILKSHRRVQWGLAPRGLGKVFDREWDLPAGYGIRRTGPLSARRLLQGELLSVVPLTLASYYVADVDTAMMNFRLVPVDRAAANVVLVEPRHLDDQDLLTPFKGGMVMDVVPVQVLADLYSLGGRFPAEADQLMDQLYPGSELT
ncbi:hypothetical protein H4P1_00046 (plasmid) [Variovorax sp. PBS-H4]|nr:hypothetical protein H4P1_00046 [Variovorax sp. PBS-H4]